MESKPQHFCHQPARHLRRLLLKKIFFFWKILQLLIFLIKLRILVKSHHELADKGVQVQAVLPGATATDFWQIGGLPLEHLPKEIVMSATDMVDAALVGFDQRELVTIPSLQPREEWDAYEAARQAMFSHLSSATPAARYA